ncbi:MAG: TonB-dependent receptor, partial [Bryobacterales bacterium]|nr:TonB-dependent receptor [Bryobacterales bacterium]
MKLRTFALILLFCACLRAQTTTGTIIGTLTDPAGRLVQAATVRAVNEATGIGRDTKSNEDGAYVFPLLPIGRYRIEIEAAGMARETLNGVILELDRTLRINVTMQLASVSESVTVTAAPPLIDTQSGAKGAVIENRRIVELPLNGRQFLELVKLTPGVAQNAGGSLRTELTGNLAGPNLTVYGARESDNYFSIDGISSSDRFYNSPTVLPSVDAIAEFKVQSSSYAAESGGQGGATINLSSKSGGDQLHGSLFHFFRNSAMDARNAFDLLDRDGDGVAEIPPFQQNQFGGTIGGPIKKSKTFFFGSYEGLRIKKSITQLQTVPTLAMRAGDFRELRQPNSAIGRIVDPLTRAEFATPNVIPQTRFDPAAQAMLDRIPLPNRPGISQNFIAQPAERNTTNQGLLRLDHNYSDADRVFARALIANAEGFLPFGTRSVLGTVRTAVPGFGNFLTLNARNVALGWTRVFSPSLVGELRLGFNRVAGGQFPQNAGNNFASTARLQGIPELPADSKGFPRFAIAGYPEFGDIEFTVDRRNNEYSGEYILSWVRQNHTYKLGGYYRRVQFAPRSFQVPRGAYQFGFSTNGPFSGNALADFLMGHPDTFNLAEVDDSHMFGNEYAGFAQSDWRPSRRLTINLGVRYEFFGTLYDKYDRLSNYDPATRSFIISSHNGKPADPVWLSNTPGYSQREVVVTNPAGTFRFPIRTT